MRTFARCWSAPRLPLYNGAARALHCRGSGTCGTCAVKIEGPVSEPTKIERVRISLPPHDREKGLRLACQCKVLGDLEVTKYQGLWGQHDDPVQKAAADDPAQEAEADPAKPR